MAQNIIVAVRIRPALDYELKHTSEITLNEDGQKVILEGRQGLKFDNVFGPNSTQERIFSSLVYSQIQAFLSGYSVSIMAFGATSGGKTFTMGSPSKSLLKGLDEKDGIIPRTLGKLFDELGKKNSKWSAKVSFLEIYNDQLRDLLSEPHFNMQGSQVQQPIQIRERMQNGYIQIYTTGNSEVPVKSTKEALSCFIKGGINRTTAQTALNEQSSRSHSIFTIILEQQLETGEVLKSRLNLVDLAGSERITKANSQGIQFKEAVNINQGLLALGNVIQVLSDPSKSKKGPNVTKVTKHVPYRDSKLTRLLQDSIGGTARCVFIACVSPSRYNFEESQVTLRYAARAKNIVNKPIRLVERQIKDEGALNKLQEENELLRQCLEKMQQQQQQMEYQMSMMQSQMGQQSSVGQNEQVGTSRIPQPGASNFLQSEVTDDLTGADRVMMSQGLQKQQISQHQDLFGQTGAITANTLNFLLNQQSNDDLEVQIQNLNEKAASNQYFNTAIAGDIYNQILKFQVKQMLNLNATMGQITKWQKMIQENNIDIDNEQVKLLVQIQAFLLQFVQFESAYEKQVLINDQKAPQSIFDKHIGDPMYWDNISQQVVREIQWINKLQQDMLNPKTIQLINPEAPLKFIADDVQQSREFYQNQLLVQERLAQLTEYEQELQQANKVANKNTVMVLDVDDDDDFVDIQYDTDLIEPSQLLYDDKSVYLGGTGQIYTGDGPGNSVVMTGRRSQYIGDDETTQDGDYDFTGVGPDQINQDYSSYIQKGLDLPNEPKEQLYQQKPSADFNTQVAFQNTTNSDMAKKLMTLEKLEDRNLALLQKLQEKQRQLQLDGYGEYNSKQMGRATQIRQENTSDYEAQRKKQITLQQAGFQSASKPLTPQDVKQYMTPINNLKNMSKKSISRSLYNNMESSQIEEISQHSQIHQSYVEGSRGGPEVDLGSQNSTRLPAVISASRTGGTRVLSRSSARK